MNLQLTEDQFQRWLDRVSPPSSSHQSSQITASSLCQLSEKSRSADRSQLSSGLLLPFHSIVNGQPVLQCDSIAPGPIRSAARLCPNRDRRPSSSAATKGSANIEELLSELTSFPPNSPVSWSVHGANSVSTDPSYPWDTNSDNSATDAESKKHHDALLPQTGIFERSNLDVIFANLWFGGEDGLIAILQPSDPSPYLKFDRASKTVSLNFTFQGSWVQVICQCTKLNVILSSFKQMYWKFHDAVVYSWDPNRRCYHEEQDTDHTKNLSNARFIGEYQQFGEDDAWRQQLCKPCLSISDAC